MMSHTPRYQIRCRVNQKCDGWIRKLRCHCKPEPFEYFPGKIWARNIAKLVAASICAVALLRPSMVSAESYWYPSSLFPNPWDPSATSVCFPCDAQDPNRDFDCPQSGSSLSNEDCCLQYYNKMQHGDDVYESCIANGIVVSIVTGGDISNSKLWYIDYWSGRCVQDCETVDSTCLHPGGFANAHAWSLFRSVTDCCRETMWWMVEDICAAISLEEEYTGSMKYYADQANGRCVQDCDVTSETCSLPGGIVYEKSVHLYEDASSCCASLDWPNQDVCQSKSDPDSTGTGMYYVDPNTNENCVLDREPSANAIGEWKRNTDPSASLYTTAKECCEAKLSWIDTFICTKRTTWLSTNKWFPSEDISTGGCAKDCASAEPPSPDGGPAMYCNNNIPDSVSKVFDTPDACCAGAFQSMSQQLCVANSLAGGNSPGSYKYHVDQENDRCVQDCDAIDGPNGPCKIPGGIVANPFIELFETAAECCTAKLGYLNEDYCGCNSNPWCLGTTKYYAKPLDGICVMDRDSCPVLTIGVQCERVTDGFTQLHESMEACCESSTWVDDSWCIRKSTDTPSGMWFLASPFSDKCVKDCAPSEPLSPSGQPADYCSDEIPSTFFEFYETAEDCCANKISYARESCVATSLGEEYVSMTTMSEGSDQYYIDWFRFKCVKNCVGPEPCGGIANAGWDHLYGSSEECCAKGLGWLSYDECTLGQGPQVLSTTPATIGQTLRVGDCVFDEYLLLASFEDSNGLACYNNDALSTVSGGPTTAQMLVMFTDGQFIQSDSGNVFVAYDGNDVCGFPKAEYSAFPLPSKKGLYRVIDQDGTCVKFRLLFESATIGQIVPSANPNLAPIEVVGVDKLTNKIYGYYPDEGSPGGLWLRKSTLWGDATDGTLAWGPNGEIGGVSTNGKLFNLWGEFESNFNYAKHDDIDCSTSPSSAANIEWGSPYSHHRGLYCVDNEGMFNKYTWHGDSDGGPTRSKLDWTPAVKIARLTPSSNIYGLSSVTGGVVTLSSCESCGGGDDVLSRPINVLHPHHTKEVAGIDGESHFFSVRYAGDVVSYVYRESECFSSWSIKEINNGDLFNLDSAGDFDHTLGNYDGHVYLLHKAQETVYSKWMGTINHVDVLYRLDVVSGPMVNVIEIQRSDVYEI